MQKALKVGRIEELKVGNTWFMSAMQSMVPVVFVGRIEELKVEELKVGNTWFMSAMQSMVPVVFVENIVIF